MTVSNVKAWDRKVPEFSYTFIEDEESGLIDFKIDFDTNNRNIFWSIRERLLELLKTYEAGAMLKPEEVGKQLHTSSDMARNYLDELVKKKKVERCRLMGSLLYRVL